LKESRKIGLAFAVIVVGYLGSFVELAGNPPGGRQAVLIARAHAQEEQ
jgi:hypothetical protein